MRISSIEFYLPEKILPNRIFEEQFGFDSRFIEEKLGIRERHYAGEDQAAHALAHEAVKKLLAGESIDPATVSLLVVVTQNPDYKLPHVSALLQNSAGFSRSLAAFDVNLGCSGFVYALAVVKGLIHTADFQRALIVTVDPYSKIISSSDRATTPLFGDAAAAVLLERTEEDNFGVFDLGTDGSGADALIVRRGGSLLPRDAEDGMENYLFMDGRPIYNFMMKTVPKSVKKCLEMNGKKMEDIDYFVCHQASKYMLESLQQRIRIPQEKMVINVEHCGNTVSSSIPIALKALIDDPDQRGKTVLLSGFGVGLSWATVIMKL